jgi:transposase
MGKVTKVKPHLSLAEIKEELRNATDADKRMRWQIVYTTASDPRDGETIAKQLGCSRWLVSDAVSRYNRLGKDAFDGPGRGTSRSWSYLTFDEEVEFLRQFINRARRGLVTTIAEIKVAFENFVGQTVAYSTITRLLERHNWRKIVPRKKHPKSSESEKESFKKNSVAWLPPPWATEKKQIADQ